MLFPILLKHLITSHGHNAWEFGLKVRHRINCDVEDDKETTKSDIEKQLIQKLTEDSTFKLNLHYDRKKFLRNSNERTGSLCIYKR